MVESHTAHPTLRDRLRSGVAVITRAHPAALLLAVAGAGFFAAPLLVAPLAALEHATHFDTAVAARGDPDAFPKEDITNVPGTAPAPTGTPAGKAPGSGTGNNGAGAGNVPAFKGTGWGSWVPPRLVPVAPAKAASRAPQEPASQPVRRQARQRRAQVTAAPVHRAPDLNPAYSGRSIGGNRQFAPGYTNGNRRSGFDNFGQGRGGYRPISGGGGGWFHGGGRRR